MKTIKNLFKKLGDNYLSFFKKYLLTNIFIIISTILTIVFLEDELSSSLFKYEIFFVANSFTVENFFKNKNPRIIGYIIAYIMSLVLGFLFNNYEKEFANYFVFYVISICSINLFYIIRKTKLEMSAYLHRIFSNLVTTTIINIVLNIGIFAVLGIINALLLPDSDFDLFLRVEIAILGFYTIPAYLYAFINKDVKITELANILLKYVIVPLTYIALLVVYLYIIKIVITHNMPSNSVFGIVLVLFIICMPVFVLFESLKLKNKFFGFTANNITYIFIPLYLLQTYAMIIRVSTYGLTKERYLGLMILIVEAIVLFLMKFKNKKYLIYTFWVFIVASLITFVIPFINYEAASINYHVHVVNSMLKDKKVSELNGEETAKLSSSYAYLKNENALNKLSVEIKDNEVKIVEPYYRDYFYNCYDSEAFEEIDISQYSKMKNNYGNKQSNGTIVDIGDYKIDTTVEANKLLTEEKIENLIYHLDENTDYYVTHLSISARNGKITNVNISGYILTK